QPYFERVLRGETVQYERQIHVRDIGLRWITATYRPTFDAAGRCDGWVAAVVDVDERKRMEDTVSRARTEAAAATPAKCEVLATASHELRSPLQGILGWLSLLKRGRLDEMQQTRALESVEHSVRLQAQLVHDIMDVSRIVAGKVELEHGPVDLTAVVESTIDE